MSNGIRLDMIHPKICWAFPRWKVQYEIRLSWKLQKKIITQSNVIASQCCHGKLQLDKKGDQAAWVNFSVSINFLHLTLYSEVFCTVSVPRGLKNKLNFKILKNLENLY